MRSEIHTVTNIAISTETGWGLKIIHTETNTVVCRETGLGLRYTQRQTELYAKRKFEV